MRAALTALEQAVGHPVEVSFAREVADRAPAKDLADGVADLANRVQVRFRIEPARRAKATPSWALVSSVGLPALANLRAVEVRDGRDRGPYNWFEPGTGTLYFGYDPQRSRARFDGAFDDLLHMWLAPRFDHRTGSAVDSSELDAYVVYLLTAVDEPSSPMPMRSRTLIELATLYGRFQGPARTIATRILIGEPSGFGPDDQDDIYGDHRFLSANTPDARAAWATWYRTFAPTLGEDQLRRAAEAIFDESVPPLPGLAPFDYAWSIFQAQAHATSPRADAAVLTCAGVKNCQSVLLRYFDASGPDPADHADRRRSLVSALLLAKDPRLTELALWGLFQQPHAASWRRQVLEQLAADRGQWEIGLGCLLIDGVQGCRNIGQGGCASDVGSSWSHSGHDGRESLIRALAYAGANASRLDPGEHHDAREDLVSLRTYTCHDGAEAAEFLALVAKDIPPDNPIRNVRGVPRPESGYATVLENLCHPFDAHGRPQ